MKDNEDVLQFNSTLIQQINVDGTLLLLDCCKRLEVRRFVFASSVGVIFIGKELIDATEDHPYPDESEYFSAYCASKAKAEKAVLAANCHTLRTCALRLRGVYGPGEPRSTDRAAEIIHRGLFLATFPLNGKPAMTQHSGVHNVTHAMYQADKELAKPESRCDGKVYHIVDADPVNSFLFWLPLILALGKSPPFLRIPFSLIYFAAYVSEWLAVWFHVPPVLNRLEVSLVGITNTYSIERAMKDFDYKPLKNHDLTEAVQYYTKYYKEHPSSNSLDIRWIMKILCVAVILLYLLIRHVIM